MFKNRVCSFAVLAVLLGLGGTRQAGAQTFGVELRANMMPASGAMGGASIARPQDLQSCLMNNPATLTQKRGTQFSFSGGWVEPTMNIDNDANLPFADVAPFQAKSSRPGSIVGNIAATQDYDALGLPATLGVGLLTISGLGVDYRGSVESNGTTAELAVLATAIGAGVQVTDRLSLGVQTSVGSATLDGVFTGVTAETPDYNLRASLGANYDLSDATSIGAFWTTEERHTFDNFFRPQFPPNAEFKDVQMELPYIFGVGVANESLMDGRLLVAVDLLHFDWSETEVFGSLWEDQFALQSGLQYTTRRGIRLRAGYTWAENATRDIVLENIGGVINPTPAANYIQALLPNFNQHRISGGIGLHDLLPGVDADLFAGGMFEATEQFGLTSTTLESYWVGFGVTWRFRRGATGGVSAPNQW
jgi:long-chain fatty acid transport protein